MYKAVVHLLDIFLISAMNVFLLRLPIWISVIASLIIYLGLYSFRVYDKDTMKSYTESLIRTLLGTIIGFVGVLIFYFFLDNFFNRHFFSTNLLFTIFLLPILHKVEYNTYEKYLPVRNYIVIGRRDEIGHIMDEISEKSMNKMRFVQYINPSPVTLEKAVSEGKSAKEQAAKIHGIIVADPKLEKEVKSQMERYKSEGLEIQYLPTVAEKYLKRIPIEIAQKFKEYYEVAFNNVTESTTKRILDIFVSTALLILYSPILLVVSICIFIEDGRPIIFKQTRIGKDGKFFDMIKLRSMRKQQTDEAKFAGQEEGRVLKIGKVIRPVRIDEVLQVINIFKGEMSLIGPRPEQIAFDRQFEAEIPYYGYRKKLAPGITGWAQVMYKYAETKEEMMTKLSYDLYYVKNQNLFLDLKIILLTIEAVVFRRGAK